ncbi:MAG TPA: response regulator [Leptospiraceae bacterium]|nr:response regulator [Leptospiraceae bacterium]HMY68363.1 response regulator [Leptospiraceae bacterium]HNF14064.1 response regulator [Leptospiraceae bacterium]HNF25203.1 response regulator [Leptospiraceae bacterium]HNI95864.1 response regulator [Leptospiraceae bacterium]
MITLKRPRLPILVVEDDPNLSDLYAHIFGVMNLEFEIFSNGKSADSALNEREYSLYIIDLDIPGMKGTELIRKIKEQKETSLILVPTGNNDSSVIIEVMKLGVFDYILKPFDLHQITKIIRKALDYKAHLDEEKDRNSFASEKLKAQIEWMNYKESLSHKDKMDSSLRRLDDMKRSFMEGASIGSMMTMIFMLKDSAVKKNDGTYSVDSELLDTLIECNDVCWHQFEGIYQITQILDMKPEFQTFTCSELTAKIPDMVKRLMPHKSHKKLQLTFPSLNSSKKVSVSYEMISNIVEELTVNAFKYAVPSSTVNIFAFIAEGYLVISVKNDVSDNPYTGIPKEYEKLVIEPFIRFHNNDEYMIKIEKYGLGLGLTIVDNVIKKHNGIFFIHDIVDYTDPRNRKTCVVAEMYLPLV